MKHFKFGTRNLARMWLKLNLIQQFVAASAVVLMLGMAAMGYWVSERIEKSVLYNTARVTALYIDSFVSPILQELAIGDKLSKYNQQRLHDLLMETAIGQRVLIVKIWKKDGLIVHSNNKQLVGKKFSPSSNLLRAFDGQLSSEFDELRDGENIDERTLNIPLFEIYSPIKKANTEQIIAVAEFYAKGDEVRSDLRLAILQSWIVVGLTTLLMMLGLFGIVRKGSLIIDDQRVTLENKITELSVLLDQNTKLQDRIKSAQQRAAETNERFLRRVGADLHDGPSQLISFALLRLDSFKKSLEKPRQKDKAKDNDIEQVRSSLKEAMHEIRSISSGLALPELENAPVTKVIKRAITAHEKSTGTTVKNKFVKSEIEVPSAVKLCLYRFVQEGLSNSYRHAAASDQTVSSTGGDDFIEVEVSDNGPGFEFDIKKMDERGLGLAGLRNRVETLGGVFHVQSEITKGTRLVVRFYLNEVSM